MHKLGLINSIAPYFTKKELTWADNGGIGSHKIDHVYWSIVNSTFYLTNSFLFPYFMTELPP